MEDLRLNPAVGNNPEAYSTAPAPPAVHQKAPSATLPAEPVQSPDSLRLLNALTEGVLALDSQGQVTYANSAAAHLLARDLDALAGQPLHELLHGNRPEGMVCGPDCTLSRLIERGRPAIGEDSFCRPSVASFPAEYTLAPVPTADGAQETTWVFSFRDIGKRAAVNRIKDEFVSTVSHELRTPLTSIRGALGLLSGGMLGPLGDKAANLLRIALTNSERLVRLINDILDLERIQSGKEPLTFRPVEISELVRQAMDGMAPMADAAGVKLIHDTTRAEVAADPDRLLQVLTNLLSNAVKFSPPNSSVSVMVRPGVTGVTLAVIDTGRGIPAEKLEAVFGRFQQVDASDSRQKGGSGLGLAICRTIVQQHSGRIWAENNPVCGATFRVFLPYRPAPLDDGAELLPAEIGHGTVLLAGVNDEARPQILGLLTRHGYKVLEARTVDETLAAARRLPEAILLDVMMPGMELDGMNGWQILPLLHQLSPGSQTPIVLLSVDEPTALGAATIPIDGWVPKPLSEDALLGELARVLCGPGEKARILVVEDDQDLAGLIRDVFERDSITVELAYGFEQTIALCPSFEPHLMVLDIGLPDGDGFNVVDWLRQHESFSRLPLVVYSGRSLSTTERRQLTLGPTHFLTKTRVQPQQLEALVLTLLRNTRLPETPSAAS